jgi:hypothetical protein
MKKIAFLVLILALCLGCHYSNLTANNKLSDSLKPKNSVSRDTIPPDTGEQFPTYNEVKAQLFNAYGRVKQIDTTIIDNNDTLTVHFKYYCLHDSSVVVPARYVDGNWDEAPKKDFIANNFASKISITKNRDTIFNKVIYKKDFDPVVNPEERKYAIMFDASFERYHQAKGLFLFGYTITIPMTDVGVPATLSVDKKGLATFHDEYYKD